MSRGFSRRRLIQLGGGAAALALTCSRGAVAKIRDAKSAGFYLPEESEPHARTFMQWPVSRKVHPEPFFLDMLQGAIATVANVIAEFEPVVMLMDQRFAAKARRKLSGEVDIWDIPTDDLWCRDAGPLFVRNDDGALAISHLKFNGWGGKQVHANDAHIARRVAERMDLPLFDNGLVGEAGGAEVDGQGTLIAHASSWVNSNRNVGSKAAVEAQMKQAFGVEKVIWAPGVKGGDITDYHIDALARFTAPSKVLIQLPEGIDPEDPWSAAAFETYDILADATDATGRSLQLTTLPEPYDTRIKSADFVASYVNYYVCNGAVISANFGDRETDKEAAHVLAALYPDREIVSLNVDPIGETGGGIHCATQQQPVG